MALTWNFVLLIGFVIYLFLIVMQDGDIVSIIADITPSPGSYGKPTAKPVSGQQGKPTPAPKTDIFGNIITPTPSPKTDIFGNPVTDKNGNIVTIKPNSVGQGTPTPSPKTDIFGNPVTDKNGNIITVKPNSIGQGIPTPSPKTDIFGNPVTDKNGNIITVAPAAFTQDIPTPSPKTDIFGNPVTRKPYSCKEGWSVWMNSDTPTQGRGDFETIAALRYSHSFCAKPQSIRCRTVKDQVPVTVTLDGSVVCDVKNGLACFNDEQSDNTCEDYEVSVYCDCGGEMFIKNRCIRIRQKKKNVFPVRPPTLNFFVAILVENYLNTLFLYPWPERSARESVVGSSVRPFSIPSYL